MPTITIRPGENGRLVVLFSYAPESVAKIKSIPGRRWDQEGKFWSVPDEPGMRERLTALVIQYYWKFDGQLIAK